MWLSDLKARFIMHARRMQTYLMSWSSFLLSSTFSSPVTQDTGQEDAFDIRDKIVKDLGMEKIPDFEHVREYQL